MSPKDNLVNLFKMVNTKTPIPILHLTYKPFEKLKHISDKTPVSDNGQKCPKSETVSK